VLSAKEGTPLAKLIALAIPVCQEAERRCSRCGPGRKPEIPDWVMAVLIMVAVLKRRKSKSAQYRFLHHHRSELSQLLGGQRLPRRSTYFDRYRRAARLQAMAVRIQGEQAIRAGWALPEHVAVDKSVIAARGPKWYARYLPERGYPRGADRDSRWTHTPYDGWVQGYAYEVIVTAKNAVVWPLLASVHPANERECRTVLPKLTQLPPATRYVLADAGYDSNACTMAVEDASPLQGRRFVCPIYHRGKPARAAVATPRRGRRLYWVQRRAQRQAFVRSPKGQRLLRQRNTSVEPFNAWLKSLFELEQCVWHRGLGNNQTQLLAAIASYQLLLRYNQQCGKPNAQVKWTLDAL
jgi:hypothetical protein